MFASAADLFAAAVFFALVDFVWYLNMRNPAS
jgi:hypothetical protein|eukprot:COSAG06_NODE_2250_length_7240_cov_7.796218_7_plen_32_part_00